MGKGDAERLANEAGLWMVTPHPGYLALLTKFATAVEASAFDDAAAIIKAQDDCGCGAPCDCFSAYIAQRRLTQRATDLRAQLKDKGHNVELTGAARHERE